MSPQDYDRRDDYGHQRPHQGQGGPPGGAADSYYAEADPNRQQYQPPAYSQQQSYGGQGYRPDEGQGYRPQGDQGYRPQGEEGYRQQGDHGYRPQGDQGYRPQGDQGYRPQGDQGYRPQGDQAYRPQGDGNNGPNDGDGDRGVLGALAGGAAGAFGGAKFGGKATGHTKSSAVIGALAGAFAGHKIQDTAEDWKDGRDEKKQEEKRRKEEEKHRRDDDDGDHGRRRSRSRSKSHSPPRRRRDSSSSSRDSSRHRRRESKDRHRRDSSGRRRESHDGPRDRGAPTSRGVHYAGGFTLSSRDIHLDAHGDYNLRASCGRPDGSRSSSTISLNQVLENDRGSFRWYTSGGGGGGPKSYTVQPGDTLRGIAGKFGTSFDEIARHNGINNPDLIYPSQVLQIPGGHGGGGGRGNFGASARHVRLVDGGQRLEAELSRNGEWVEASINLDERISNDNGTLRLI